MIRSNHNPPKMPPSGSAVILRNETYKTDIHIKFCINQSKQNPTTKRTPSAQQSTTHYPPVGDP